MKKKMETTIQVEGLVGLVDPDMRTHCHVVGVIGLRVGR